MTSVGVERTLHKLFRTLWLRGRSAQAAAAFAQRQRRHLARQLLLLGVVGLFPVGLIPILDAFTFATVLHTATLLLCGLSLLQRLPELLDGRDAAILGHYPIAPVQMIRARVRILCELTLLEAIALNAPSLFAGCFAASSSWWFPATHVFTTALFLVFLAALALLAMFVCARVVGHRYFDRSLVLSSLVLVAAAQLVPLTLVGLWMPGSDDSTRAVAATISRAVTEWAVVLPTAWFGALDALLLGNTAHTILPATIGLGATALAAVLAAIAAPGAFRRAQIAPPPISLQTERKRRRPRVLSRLVMAPPLQWWLRDPIERHAFVLTGAYILRDRGTTLRLVGIMSPALLPLSAAIVGSAAKPMPPVLMPLTALIPMLALTLLRLSEQWPARVWFAAAPLAHYAPVFDGARKAVIVLIGVPTVLLVGGALAITTPSVALLTMLVATLMLLSPISMLANHKGKWMPLSEPNLSGPDLPALLAATAGTGLAGALTLGAVVIGEPLLWCAIFGVAMLCVGRMQRLRILRHPWSLSES